MRSLNSAIIDNKPNDNPNDWQTNELIKELQNIKGKQVLDIGLVREVREGGIGIDYLDKGEKRRIVIGYNDLGAWVEWSGPSGKPSTKDLIIDRLEKEYFDVQPQPNISYILYQPERLRYMFLDDDRNDVFYLSVKDLHTIKQSYAGENVINFFKGKDIENEDQVGEVLFYLTIYCYD